MSGAVHSAVIQEVRLYLSDVDIPRSSLGSVPGQWKRRERGWKRRKICLFPSSPEPAACMSPLLTCFCLELVLSIRSKEAGNSL